MSELAAIYRLDPVLAFYLVVLSVVSLSVVSGLIWLLTKGLYRGCVLVRRSWRRRYITKILNECTAEVRQYPRVVSLAAQTPRQKRLRPDLSPPDSLEESGYLGTTLSKNGDSAA
jgi:hypothetical protein